MLSISQKMNRFLSSFDYPSDKERRFLLNSEMTKMMESGHNCYSCVGHCCTFAYNSMQVTPLEALDCLLFLHEESRVDQALVERLEETVKSYRLDYEILIGGSRSMRRQYTCPFFEAGPKGCTISKHSKPYGCLAFNPLERNVSIEGKCKSQISLLEKHDHEMSRYDDLNERIKESLKLSWNKKNLPVALLDLIKKFQ